MKKVFVKLFLVATIFFSLTGIVSAQDCAEDPYEIPYGCDDNYTIDFNCQNRRIMDPSETCCIHKCKDQDDPTAAPEQLDELEVFGFRIAIDATKKIPVLINLLFTTALGLVSVYTVVVGIYYAGVKRAKATTSEEIESINKTLKQLTLGFIIAWGFIFIVQFVFNLLGLGSLNDMIIIERIGETSPDSINVVTGN
jgi:hypothetical protein